MIGGLDVRAFGKNYVSIPFSWFSEKNLNNKNLGKITKFDEWYMNDVCISRLRRLLVHSSDLGGHSGKLGMYGALQPILEGNGSEKYAGNRVGKRALKLLFSRGKPGRFHLQHFEQVGKCDEFLHGSIHPFSPAVRQVVTGVRR